MKKNIVIFIKVLPLILLVNTFLAAQQNNLAKLRKTTYIDEPIQATHKYWVVFRDKGAFAPNARYVSVQTWQNRRLLGLPLQQISDVPVATQYIQQLQKQKIRLCQRSKWLNAVSVRANAAQRTWLRQQAFVKEVSLVYTQGVIAAQQRTNEPSKKQFATVLKQMKAQFLVEAGLNGKSIKIGIIDVGFDGADKLSALKHIFKDKRFLGGRDFVKPSNKKMFNRQTNDDYHGTQVWRAIAGKTTQRQFGLATGAQFYIARTDHGVTETRTEEDNWIAAVEWMDSLGVRIVNTSLGYSDGFTNRKEDYTPQEMDGKTSKISRAADIAVKQKGMLMVVSAGNEGAIQWKVVSTPGDAKEALSVGATNKNFRAKAGYSSIGPDFLPYLKPNVSCFASNGTSFSAPVISGLAACLLQKKPSLKNTELRAIIEKSAHLYPYGNNYIGYGIPQANVALKLINEPLWKPDNVKTMEVTKDKLVLEKLTAKKVVVFHKRDQYQVQHQQRMKVGKDQKVVIKRHKRTTQRTTIDIGHEVIEIYWK
ncbi:S8 family peptidase [Microscilla marina]|uniref:Putative exported serine protease, subtilase family n=1 Tax=Microscilla marina ATCC 23134 TaxID=313606 RepID=A1ZUY8_MICM2|nr:S8 family serine peptidase [Microscilla marina]EAY25766.1 putative exported serine protease, subtilase family [Microscilla marina ATCC 23134]